MMNKFVILSLVVLLIGCDGSAALRPGAARLGAKIAPTTAPAPEIAPTTAPGAKIAPTTGDDSLAILHLATAVSEVAPTVLEIAPTTQAKLHQQHIRGEDQTHAIYGGQDTDSTWIAVALLGAFLIVVWAIWIGRSVTRRTEKQR